MSRVLAAIAVFAIVVSSFAFSSNVALGHERRNVGPYTFVVGWLVEPAYVNNLNALDLTVSETQGAKAVEGLEKTLQAEVIVGGAAKTMPLKVAPRFGLPGKYQGQVLPTKTGDYSFHIFGTVGTTKVKVRKAGTVKVRVKPTAGQRAAIARARSVKVTLKISFVPAKGARTQTKVILRLRD